MGGFSKIQETIGEITTLGVLTGANRLKKQREQIESQNRQLAQQKAETERQAEETRIAKESVKAQKRKARMQTVFAGREREERPSLYKRRLGATTEGLTKTLSGNV